MSTRTPPGKKTGPQDHVLVATRGTYHDIARGAQRAIHVDDVDGWRAGQVVKVQLEGGDEPYVLARVTHVCPLELPGEGEELEDPAAGMVSLNIGLSWGMG